MSPIEKLVEQISPLPDCNEAVMAQLVRPALVETARVRALEADDLIRRGSANSKSGPESETLNFEAGYVEVGLSHSPITALLQARPGSIYDSFGWSSGPVRLVKLSQALNTGSMWFH